MNDTQPKNSIQQAVLDKIRTGKVRRRPKFYFVLRIIVTAAVSLLLLAVSAFVISFILFSLHESGEQFLLGYGWQGIQIFFKLFPWVFAVLTIALILLLEWLLKGFKFGYRIPMLTIFSVIVGISIVLGILINLTPIHLNLLHDADNDNLPILGNFYEHIFDSHEEQGICRGEVTSIGDGSFVIQHNDRDHDGDDGSFTISIPSGSHILLPHIGDHVLIFGDPQPGNKILAKNVEIVPTPPQ
jgi:hypothetical protein